MNAYKCDKCGTFRNPTKDPAMRVEWWVDGSEIENTGGIDLCPDCAPAVLASLEAIAHTESKA